MLARNCSRSVVFRCRRSLINRSRRTHSNPSSVGKKNEQIVESSSNKNNREVKDENQEALDFLAERGRALGLNLTASERRLITDEASKNSGKMRPADWEKLVSRRFFAENERLTLSDYLAKSHDLHLGQHMLKWTARLGISFFALTGSHTAGEESVGFHVVGCTLVGCITALGGGTVNSLVTGSPVGWVRDPSFLVITVCSSLVGFYVWPLVERIMLGSEDEDDGTENTKNETTETNKQENDEENHDKDGPSGIRYALESVALGALAVVGAQQGIVRGLHPLVSSSLGVTIAFGGVLRDLMCHRDLSLGAADTGCQSYGIASFSGAAVYVALRELHVWNCAGSTKKLLKGGIPIGLRIFLGFGTVFGIRAFAWHNKPDGILLTMDESATANEKRLQAMLSCLKPNP